MALPEVGLLGLGCWRIVRMPQNLCLTPLPGVRSMLLFFGIAVWTLLQATPLTRSMESSPKPGQGLSISAFKGCSSALNASRSVVTGSHVLLSIYVARVLSRGPGILSSFCHPSWVVSLVLQNLIGAPTDIRRAFFLVLKALFLLASASAGLIGVFHAVSFRGSDSRGWGEVSFSFVPGFVAKNQGSSSLASRFVGFTVPAQPNARQSQWETVISCAGGRVLPGRWAAHRQRFERFLFCRRV